jgi:hypothetical protein
LFLSTPWPVNTFTVLYNCKNFGMWYAITCIYGVTRAFRYPFILSQSEINRLIHSLALSW